MMRITSLLFGLILSSMTFAAELLQSTNNCDSQQKADFCVNTYCLADSVISENTDCTQICDQCAKAACEEYDNPSDVCNQLSL